MATLLLKASHKEQHCVIHFLWAKGLCPNAIYSERRPVYGDKCFTRPVIHVWCKKFACGRKSVVNEKIPGWCVVLTTDAAIAAVTSLIWSDQRVNKCWNKFELHLHKNFTICVQLNYVPNLCFELFTFSKLTELCHFVTYLSNDPRTDKWQSIYTVWQYNPLQNVHHKLHLAGILRTFIYTWCSTHKAHVG